MLALLHLLNVHSQSRHLLTFILVFHPEPAMRLRNPSMDGSGGSQLFEDTSSGAVGSHTAYRCRPSAHCFGSLWKQLICVFNLIYISEEFILVKGFFCHAQGH